MPTPASKASTLVWIRKPTRKPTMSMRSTTKTLRTRSASGAPGQHRGAGHRQRAEPLDEALLQVVGEADRRC